MYLQRFALRVIGLLLIITVTSCNPDEELPVTAFFNENFDDLNSSDLSTMETPFEAIFGDVNNIGGRTEDSFGDLATIAERLANIFPNVSILEINVEEYRGLTVWIFKIKMESGGILKFLFVQELGKIVKIKGKNGPFDYEIDPGGSFIPLSKAMRLALDAVGGGEVHSWSLCLEERNRWEYEFHIVFGDKRYEVEIHGWKEEVLSIRVKGPDQDVDNNGGDGGEDEIDREVPEEIVRFAKTMFDGKVKHAEKRKDGDRIIWKLYMINEHRSVVKLLIWNDPMRLEKAGSEHGPFEYNFEPGGDLLDLRSILEKVYRETEGGELVAWILEKEIIKDVVNDQERRWVYKLKVVRGKFRYEIVIDAVTGKFLKFEVHD